MSTAQATPSRQTVETEPAQKRRAVVRGLLALPLVSVASVAPWIKPAADIVVRDGWILSKAD